MKKALAIAIFVSCFSTALLFAQVTDVQFLEKEVDARVNVAGGLYQADLKIIFENVTGLNPNSLTISAAQIDPMDLLSRLSDPALISIPGQFPVLITITPTAGSTLSFTGVVTIDISTSNLTFNSSLRLFTSPSGGSFYDITNFSGVGSYRVHGTGGGFSDFVIVTDVRNAETVIQSKFTALQDALNSNASLISPITLQNLQSKYNAALTAYQSGSKDQSVTNLNAMIDFINSGAGTSIPNTYSANDPATKNVAGELRKRAGTLIFSLRL
jgi:hypothetical protein